MKRIKIKIIEGTIVHGLGDVRPGTILRVEPQIARQLFVAGKAVTCAEKTAKPTTRKVQSKK